MKYKILVMILSAVSITAFATLPPPSVLPKNGNCPANYIAKGNDCEPTKENDSKMDMSIDIDGLSGGTPAATAPTIQNTKETTMNEPTSTSLQFIAVQDIVDERLKAWAERQGFTTVSTKRLQQVKRDRFSGKKRVSKAAKERKRIHNRTK